jgi:transcriptional regulator with XRE-family HTH domain
MSKFAIRFASEYKGFMKSAGISGAQLAEKLGRGEGYVSERINGKRAIDTNDIDALARLAEGWDGRSLMIELARRVRYRAATQCQPLDRDCGSEDSRPQGLRCSSR